MKVSWFSSTSYLTWERNTYKDFLTDKKRDNDKLEGPSYIVWGWDHSQQWKQNRWECFKYVTSTEKNMEKSAIQ